MSKSAIQRLDVDAPVRKRAQWEAFEFSLIEGGRIEVRNSSYPDDEVGDHTYEVHVENGEPVHCGCPYGEHYDGDCKHMAAVAIRGPLLESASASEDTCPNGDPQCGGPDGDELPCFQCYMQAEGV